MSDQLLADRDQIAHIENLFRYADEGTWASLRTFFQNDRARPPFIIRATRINGDLNTLIDEAFDVAQKSLKADGPTVFAPPIATFNGSKSAAESEVANGLTLSCDWDDQPYASRSAIERLLGPPTLVVASGSDWIDQTTGEVQPKLHGHYRLSEPTRTLAEHNQLRHARRMAAMLTGADPTGVPIGHPLRWPGSLNMKGATPRLAKAIAFNTGAEIHLDEAVERLEDAVEAAGLGKQTVAVSAGSPEAPIPIIQAAMEFIPNSGADVHYDDWIRLGYAIYRACGGAAEAFDIWDRWSAKSDKYDGAETERAWQRIVAAINGGHAHSQVGAGTICFTARANGWVDPRSRAARARKAQLHVNGAATEVAPPHQVGTADADVGDGGGGVAPDGGTSPERPGPVTETTAAPDAEEVGQHAEGSADKGAPHGLDAEIDRLTRLPEGEYFQEKAASAKAQGLRVRDLDHLVGKRREELAARESSEKMRAQVERLARLGKNDYALERLAVAKQLSISVANLDRMVRAKRDKAAAQDGGERLRAEIERLAGLPNENYASERRPTATDLGIGVGELDRMVRATRDRFRVSAEQQERAKPPPGPGETRWPSGYEMRSDGLYRVGEDDEKDTWLCAPFQVLGDARDGDGEGWGRWLAWKDSDGRVHKSYVANRLLVIYQPELEALLYDGGLNLSPDAKARSHLREALSKVVTGDRVTVMPQPGWHISDTGAAYVLMDGTTIGRTNEHLVLRDTIERAKRRIAAAGTLKSWQENIAHYGRNNPIAGFMLCAAFAGPLLTILGEPTGGFHFHGRSKAGKTLMLRMALSVWGSPEKSGVLRDWHSTVNAFEAVAEQFNDNILGLDEIHQANPLDLIGAIYQLANEGGKSRLGRSAAVGRARTWRTMILSTGEVDVETMLAKVGKTMPAGAEIRLPSIPLPDTTVWLNLHGFETPSDLVQHLQKALPRHHGTAGRAFLQHLTRLIGNPEKRSETEELFAETRRQLEEGLPPHADAQVRDVVRRCALVATAGELAIAKGVLPWEAGDAQRLAAAIVGAWVGKRGSGSASGEDSGHIRAVRSFLVEHGSARFTRIGRDSRGAWFEEDPHRIVHSRAGWRRAADEDEGGTRPKNEFGEEIGALGEVFMIATDIWDELCREAGYNPQDVAATLVKAGLVVRGEGKNLAKKVRLPVVGLTRAYVVLPGIFTTAEEPTP